MSVIKPSYKTLYTGPTYFWKLGFKTASPQKSQVFQYYFYLFLRFFKIDFDYYIKSTPTKTFFVQIWFFILFSYVSLAFLQSLFHYANFQHMLALPLSDSQDPLVMALGRLYQMYVFSWTTSLNLCWVSRAHLCKLVRHRILLIISLCAPTPTF